ncbi:MAG: glutamate--cysteine ligase [Candidatus Sericytochromatia bacterium]|nr:MAG: glutamate--cysteine ligase [Candidatus Sericytochromatia bacterium]
MERNEIIESKAQLLKYFTSSYKKKDDWKIGIEYEKFIIKSDLKPLDYFNGKESISNFFKTRIKLFGGTPEIEEGNIIAIYDKGYSLSLEPGGQIELSGTPYKNLHYASKEVEEHLKEIKTITNDWNSYWYVLGMNPFHKNEDIPWMPKLRYKIMKEYLIKKGHLSHKMMKQTATIQANIDYESEEDAINKLRIATALNSIVTAIFANSPIYNGNLNGFMSERAYTWKFTDPERCGIIKNLFSSNYSFEDYINYVLNVKMFLIKRDNKVINMTSMSFKDFMEKGYNGYKATYYDWTYHLSTVFPEVRLLKYIELRGADSQKPELAMAIPAIWKGILYNNSALEYSWELVKNLTYDERINWHEEVSRKGLKAKVRKYQTKDLAKELFNIAYESLKIQKELNEKNQDESIYLENLYEIVIKKGKSPAEYLVEKWENNYNKDLYKLLQYCKI